MIAPSPTFFLPSGQRGRGAGALGVAGGPLHSFLSCLLWFPVQSTHFPSPTYSRRAPQEPAPPSCESQLKEVKGCMSSFPLKL